MKTATALLSAAAIFALTSGAAFADCVDTSAVGTDTNKTAAISKDGTNAPLEPSAKPDDSSAAASDTAAGTDAATSDSVAKDGKTMPLATEEGGGNKDLATSEQDVEAQQDGEQTAAATAEANKDACD